MIVHTILHLKIRIALDPKQPITTSAVGPAVLRDRRLAPRRLGYPEGAARNDLGRKVSIADRGASALVGCPAQLYRGGA